MKTYEEILQKMLGKVPSDVDKREGSVIYDALAPCAYHYMQWALEVPGVGAAKVFPLRNGLGTVMILIVNSNKGIRPVHLELVYECIYNTHGTYNNTTHKTMSQYTHWQLRNEEMDYVD